MKMSGDFKLSPFHSNGDKDKTESICDPVDYIYERMNEKNRANRLFSAESLDKLAGRIAKIENAEPMALGEQAFDRMDAAMVDLVNTVESATRLDWESRHTVRPWLKRQARSLKFKRNGQSEDSQPEAEGNKE